MSKKLYEESNIQNIAKGIREINGSIDTYKTNEMKTALDGVVSEVSNQADLINQIKTALEGKAGGGAKIVTVQVNANGNLIYEEKHEVGSYATLYLGNAYSFLGAPRIYLEDGTIILGDESNYLLLRMYNDTIGVNPCSIIKMFVPNQNVTLNATLD